MARDKNMAKLAFLGMGVMGAPMAGHLLKAGHEVTVRRYLEDAPGEAEIYAARNAIGTDLLGMIRRGEKVFKEASLTKDSSDEDLLAAMVAHPILIERPIAFAGGKAVIGRPPERVLDIT